MIHNNEYFKDIRTDREFIDYEQIIIESNKEEIKYTVLYI